MSIRCRTRVSEPNSPLPSFVNLRMYDEVSIGATSKRKANGDLAETRLGKVVTTRWLNERFREVMMLVHEFRSEWPNQSLLSNDDVEAMLLVLV